MTLEKAVPVDEEPPGSNGCSIASSRETATPGLPACSGQSYELKSRPPRPRL